MNIAYRFRIYPTEEQKILLGKTFGCCRFLYNQMLNDKIREYKKTKKMLKNTPAMYKKEYPFLKEVDSLALANVQLHLGKPIRIFSVTRRLDFHVSSQNITPKTAIQQMWSTEIFWWKDKRIRLPKLKWISMKKHREPAVENHPIVKILGILQVCCMKDTAAKKPSSKMNQIELQY